MRTYECMHDSMRAVCTVFWHNTTSVWQADGRTDRQADGRLDRCYYSVCIPCSATAL